MRLPSFDIRSKLTGLAFALVGVVVCALTLYFSALQLEAMDRRLQAKAVTYAHLLARQTESSIALGDAKTTREIFAAAESESDLSAVTLYREDGAILGAYGSHAIDPRPVDEAVVERRPSLVGVLIPVISKEGPRGILVLELSTTAIDREASRTRRGALLAGSAALALGLVASWLIGGSFAKRLRRIQRVTQAFAKGKLNEPPIVDASNDEIGQLGRAFNTMAARIHSLIDVLETDSREETARLDGIVTARTAELRKKNQDLAFFLEHLDQGFMTVDSTGFLAPERSTVLKKWFGAADEQTQLWHYIGARDPQTAARLAIGWESIFDGFLPPELAIDQMPSEVRFDEYTLGLRYQHVCNEDGSVDKVIVVISDISDEIARRRAEATQKELAMLCGRVVADPRAVELFISEGTQILRALGTAREDGAALTDQQRWLHTLKGNSGFLGLDRLAELCHTMETHVLETGEGPTVAARLALEGLWAEFLSTVTPLLSGTRRGEIALRRTVLLQHIDAIRAGKSRSALASDARLWLLEPATERLERAAEQARAIARRLEKSNIEVTVEDNDVRLDAEAWGGFWSAFVHVVRNAVDHGIEDEETRRSASKPATGKIVLRALQSPTEDIIEIEDDGAGIDWDALRQRAAEAGLSSSEAEPVELLFADGVSTKDEITETSGRGIGLGACRALCEEMGGRVVVTTVRGSGTTFSFRVPRGESLGLATSVAA